MKKYFFRLLSMVVIILFATLSANSQYNMSEAQLPFQSTSTMQSSGSRYVSTPTINAYGVAEYNGASYSPNKIGIRRSESNPGTPGEGEYQQPIGDAPIAFMLGLGVLYILVMRKKERVED